MADGSLRDTDTIREARELANELELCWQQLPSEWAAYPWEHLGDADRDIRRLVAGLFAVLVERDRLKEAAVEVAHKTEGSWIADRLRAALGVSDTEGADDG